MKIGDSFDDKKARKTIQVIQAVWETVKWTHLIRHIDQRIIMTLSKKGKALSFAVFIHPKVIGLKQSHATPAEIEVLAKDGVN